MDLGNAQLRQLMEDLWQKVVLRQLNAPLRGPLSDCWRTLARGGDPNVANKITPKGEGMGTQQAATMVHRPPHTEENVGHLLSTLAAR